MTLDQKVTRLLHDYGCDAVLFELVAAVSRANSPPAEYLTRLHEALRSAWLDYSRRYEDDDADEAARDEK